MPISAPTEKPVDEDCAVDGAGDDGSGGDEPSGGAGGSDGGDAREPQSAQSVPSEHVENSEPSPPSSQSPSEESSHVLVQPLLGGGKRGLGGGLKASCTTTGVGALTAATSNTPENQLALIWLGVVLCMLVAMLWASPALPVRTTTSSTTEPGAMVTSMSKAIGNCVMRAALKGATLNDAGSPAMVN